MRVKNGAIFEEKEVVPNLYPKLESPRRVELPEPECGLYYFGHVPKITGTNWEKVLQTALSTLVNKVTIAHITLATLAGHIKRGELRLDTPCQRGEVWDSKRENEHLLFALALGQLGPPFIWNQRDGVFWDIDGKQRITVHMRFMNNEIPIILHDKTKLWFKYVPKGKKGIVMDETARAYWQSILVDCIQWHGLTPQGESYIYRLTNSHLPQKCGEIFKSENLDMYMFFKERLLQYEKDLSCFFRDGAQKEREAWYAFFVNVRFAITKEKIYPACVATDKCCTWLRDAKFSKKEDKRIVKVIERYVRVMKGRSEAKAKRKFYKPMLIFQIFILYRYWRSLKTLGDKNLARFLTLLADEIDSICPTSSQGRVDGTSSAACKSVEDIYFDQDDDGKKISFILEQLVESRFKCQGCSKDITKIAFWKRKVRCADCVENLCKAKQ
jgi:hypothetical protein